MKNTSASAAQLHRLVYAGLIAKPDVHGAFAAEDPRHDVELWRAFARSTVLPLGVALVVSAIVLAVGASSGEQPSDISPVAFALGAFAALIAALINTGKRALLPAGVAFGVMAALVGANIAGVRALRREEEVAMLVALVLAAAFAWALARTQRAPGGVPLDDDAIAFLAPMSTAKRVACVLVWIVGAPIAFASFVAFMDERDLGVPQLVLGLFLFALGAYVSRMKRPLAIARQAGLLAFVTGTLYIVGALIEHVDIHRDVRPLLALPVLVVGWLAVRSWPLRALWGAVLAAALLAAFEEADHAPGTFERSDDVFVVVVAALTTFALTRGRYVRPVGVAGGLALLVLASIEMPSIGADAQLALGTFTSLGATACAIGATLVVMHGASVAARALVCTVLFFAGALYIDAPAIVLCALVLLLARQARIRFLEVVAFIALLAAAWALVDKPWAVLEAHAIKAALTAVVLLAVGLTLRRIPSTPPARALPTTT